MHRSALERHEWMIRDGIPVTNPRRTLIDIAAQVTNAYLETAINEAQVQRLVSPSMLPHLISEYSGRPGIRALRDQCDEPRMTRSAAERRFLSLLHTADLPLPHTNVKLAGREVDFLWRDERLVVEIDGWAAHSSRTAFEDDRRRDAALAALGYTVIRISWSRLVGEPDSVIEQLARTLGATPRRTAGSGWR